MSKLSIVIPSREEKFLTPTIDDIFRNCRNEDTEVIAVLDSDKWPSDWKEVTARHPRLHTIHHGAPRGMRAAINSGVSSAAQRGAKYVMKLDGHCMLDEGFDEKLLATIEPNWIVIPRRKRLDADNWTLTDTHKPDVDYHFLSFPDDPNDFGGPGLNGKIWPERALARKDILIDDEMSSQGSAWLCATEYFYELDLMDEQSFGPFWCEAQEVLMKAWLSGGRCVVNKNTWYAHLHKGSKHGRGYHLPEKWLKQGRNRAMQWIYNEGWPKQTLPFTWLINKFMEQSGSIPSWPDNWEEVLYAQRRPRALVGVTAGAGGGDDSLPINDNDSGSTRSSSLIIREARYGVLAADGLLEEGAIDVTERVRSLICDSSLDIVVNNSTLTPNQNPFRGTRKTLEVIYSFDGSAGTRLQRKEKDWLIIGHQQMKDGVLKCEDEQVSVPDTVWGKAKIESVDIAKQPMTAPALNDFLIRRFSISPQRLRGPMPIEVPQFHRNDLAQLFAELGFKRGAEIGVAEGNYSEVLLKANPECELLLVDPWHHYGENPQGKSKEKHTYAFNEMMRKTDGYEGRRVQMMPSMKAVANVEESWLDFCYIDGNHLFDYVMQDLIEWSKRVRSGGIVSGDDYYALDQKRWIGGGVVEAVQAYTNAHRIPIWYLFQGHKSVDFMWVKP